MKRFALILLFLHLPAMAQTNAGAITGTIADQQNAVLSGAKVVAKNLATNIQQTATTTSSGVYSVPALEPGTYRITVEMAGFNKLIREPIQVETSKTVTLDLELSIGNTTVEITVKAEAALVQESNSTIAYTVNQKQLDELKKEMAKISK